MNADSVGILPNQAAEAARTDRHLKKSAFKGIGVHRRLKILFFCRANPNP
jgi:hypothetical protein